MVRNILAVIGGLIVGSIVNMGIVTLSAIVIPPPPGADMSTMEGVIAAMPLFESKHFIFPFLAHAMGTLVGALVAALIATERKLTPALVVGAFFLLGGIYMVWTVPAPMWFEAADVLLAYIPMAFIGAKLGGAGRSM